MNMLLRRILNALCVLVTPRVFTVDHDDRTLWCYVEKMVISFLDLPFTSSLGAKAP